MYAKVVCGDDETPDMKNSEILMGFLGIGEDVGRIEAVGRTISCLARFWNDGNIDSDIVLIMAQILFFF